MHAPAPVAPPAASEPAYRELLRTIGLFRRVMDPYFARHGISGAQWAVLRQLHAAEKGDEAEPRQGLRLADLVGKLLVRPPSVTHVVERLRVAGLLHREASATDHRAKVVHLTDAGRELVERIYRGHAGQIDSVMAGLEAGEQAALCGLLQKLSTHLSCLAPRDAATEEP